MYTLHQSRVYSDQRPVADEACNRSQPWSLLNPYSLPYPLLLKLYKNPYPDFLKSLSASLSWFVQSLSNSLFFVPSSHHMWLLQHATKLNHGLSLGFLFFLLVTYFLIPCNDSSPQSSSKSLYLMQPSSALVPHQALSTSFKFKNDILVVCFSQFFSSDP